MNWNLVLKKSKGLDKPCITSLTESIFTLKDIVKVFADLSIDKTQGKNNYLRVYNGFKEDYKSAVVMSAVCPTDSNIERWLKSVTLSDKGGVVVNGSVCWSDYIYNKLVKYTSGLYEIIESQGIFTFDATIFVGGYGYTPFGVHIDDPDHRTFILNLGPNEKKYYLWEPNFIKDKLGDISNFYYPDEILEDSDEYIIKKDEGFFLPPRLFHVGLASEFSISLAIVIKKQNAAALVCNEFKGLFLDSLEKQNLDVFLSSDKFCSDDNLINKLFNEKSKNFNWLLERSLTRLRSNNNFFKLPFLRANEVDTSKKFIAPHSVYLLENERNVEIFGRGRSIALPKNKNVFKFYDLLNSRKAFSVVELSETCNFDTDLCLFILKTLYSNRMVDTHD